MLRVEPAKVSFLETRKREREEDELAELEESIPQKAAASKDAHVVPFTGEKPLELVQPDGKVRSGEYALGLRQTWSKQEKLE